MNGGSSEQTNSSEDLLLLKGAVEAARNGIIVTDPRQEDNPIIYVNPSFSEITGFRPDQILGRNCRFLQRDDRDQENIKLIREAISNEMPITTIVRNYKRTGELFWNELTISPVHDESGKLINFVGIQNDITARKEAERRVSEFYSVISHELRTPLTAIDTCLRTIEDGTAGKINANVLRLIRIALDSSERLMRLINDILDWKKMESGKFRLFRKPISPESVIDTVIENMRPMAEKDAVELRKVVKGQREIVADPDRLIQILSNLVSNAIKFSPTRGVVTITLNVVEPDIVRFEVVDQGPGIPADQLYKLFKLFQQLDGSERRPAEGTGLGLAISKSLVELHGGQIGVDSEPGKGSVFWFEIT